jgi:hypothetical protein
MVKNVLVTRHANNDFALERSDGRPAGEREPEE